jgi:regulator of protease activity HflC (stomatin/prohibitin superfamily)
MNPITLFIVAVFAATGGLFFLRGELTVAIVFWVTAAIVAQSLKMANTWQKFVVLRAGKLQGVRGPGLFLMIPVLDRVVAVIDERIQTTAFNAEQALTRDTVPVNVDAIIFWHVHDARKAALAITDYQQAIARVAQTSLREMIGSSLLAALLSDRRAADLELSADIGRKTVEWGVTVRSVEIRDVAIPVALQDAMSRQAQAEREKQARIILGSAEAEIAGKFVEAARVYADQPMALQLRAMNIIYETTKERGTTILIPSSMVDSMNPAAAVALSMATRAGATPPFEAGTATVGKSHRRSPLDDGPQAEQTNEKPAEWNLTQALSNLVSEGGYVAASDDAGPSAKPFRPDKVR